VSYLQQVSENRIALRYVISHSKHHNLVQIALTAKPSYSSGDDDVANGFIGIEEAPEAGK
jgi:hypothetical protein